MAFDSFFFFAQFQKIFDDMVTNLNFEGSFQPLLLSRATDFHFQCRDEAVAVLLAFDSSLTLISLGGVF